MNKQNYVWSTYVSTKEYMLSALVLGEQLKKVKSKYPLVIAMTKEVYLPYHKLVTQMGYIPELINTVEYHEQLQKDFVDKPNFYRLLKTSSRISIFDLTQYDKMVFIDTDVWFYKNCDELFDCLDGSMVKDPEEAKHIHNEGGFEGLLVFIPKNYNSALYAALLKAYPMMTSELFSILWFPIKTNPDYIISPKYFHDFGAYYMIKKKELNYTINIAHFCKNKPWQINLDNELYNTEEVQSYLKLYNEIKDKANSFLT